MNSLHVLYLESLLNIKIGEFESHCAVFTGHVTLEQITQACANSGAIYWQNPESPIIDKAYLTMPVDGGSVDFAIDYNFNTILFA